MPACRPPAVAGARRAPSALRAACVASALVLCGIATAAGPAAGPYSIHENARFDFSIEVPAILEPRGTTGDGAGQRFASRAGDASAWVRGSHARECTAAGMIDEPDASSVTYRFAKGGVSVVSGYLRGNVFYKKAVRSRGRCLMLDIEYDVRSRKIYDAVTTRMANSFGG